MSRRKARAMTAIVAAAAMIAASFVGVQVATAAVCPCPAVSNLSATPQPPKEVKISWNAYAGFTVDHYQATLQPGSRVIDTQFTNATFVDLVWSQSYTATVIAVGTGVGETSDLATLDIKGTKLSGSISPSTAKRGSKPTVSGTLRKRNDSPIPNATVKVEVALFPYPPYNYQSVGSAKTNNKGAFALNVKANRNSVYQVLYDAPGTAGGWDGSIRLAVRVPVSLKFSANPVRFGNKVRFSGALNCPASLVAGAPLRLQHKVKNHWKTAKSTTVNGQGKYAIGYKPKSRDDQAWRVISEAGDSFATSTSKARVLVVR